VIALVVAVAALFACSGTAHAAPTALTTDKGVVQEVTTSSIVLRGLDGSTLSLALGPFTVVRLNGNPASLADLRPGLVASVTHNGDRPARIVRAFGTVKIVELGVVESVSRLELVLRRADGTLLGVALGPETRVRKFGQPARRSAVKPGKLVRVTYSPGSPAILVAVVRRPG
jgi:hypothetical protein